MDVEVYVAARRGRLVEAALAHGWSDEEAPEVVDRLIEAHRRLVERSDDPHPAMLDALAAARDGGSGRTGHDPSRWGWVALLAVVAVVATGALVSTLRGPALQSRPTLRGQAVPLLFLSDVAQASTRLRLAGAVPYERRVESCAPVGAVLQTDPAPGTPLAPGQGVEISTPLPGNERCPFAVETAQGLRLLRFVTGRGEAPRFADSVAVFVDDGEAIVLSGRQAAIRSTWGPSTPFDLLLGRQAVGRGGAYPQLTAVPLSPRGRDPSRCGLREPPTLLRLRGVRVTVESPDLGDDDVCALSVELFADRDGITAVVLQRPPTLR